jgi:HSP20 family protein
MTNVMCFLREEVQQKEEGMAPIIARSDTTDRPAKVYQSSPFRLFGDFFNDWAARSLEAQRSEGWMPPVDIVERDGNLTIMVSLPGMNNKDIELKIEGQVLTVSAERSSKESDGYIYHQRESFHGSFSRSFTLPNSADLQSIRAEYNNGILAVDVPLKPEVKARRIQINT